MYINVSSIERNYLDNILNGISFIADGYKIENGELLRLREDIIKEKLELSLAKEKLQMLISKSLELGLVAEREKAELELIIKNLNNIENVLK